MTIAACFVTPEGVVFGADSTTTAATAGGNHYYNHSQKIFEIGSDATIAGLIWGMGGLPEISYRRLFAQVGDRIKLMSLQSVEEVAKLLIDDFWGIYSGAQLVVLCGNLSKKIPHDPSCDPAPPEMRTNHEEDIFKNLKANLVAGLCIGGYVRDGRMPCAYSVLFDPLAGKPVPIEVSSWSFWGTPVIVQRLIFGCDDELKAAILKSGKWGGTPDELKALIDQQQFTHPITLPMRDAVDFIHSSISATIKTLKFSNLSQTCGGPIELAVITADRPFRWVRHKSWDSAISDGGT